MLQRYLDAIPYNFI